MNTYRYQIAKLNDEGILRVTEGNSPWAKATGNYSTLEEAQSAIEEVAGKPLDFEWMESEGVEYWSAEFEMEA